MFLSAFFKGSWLVQLIVGIGLFACSFFLEYRVLRSFFSPQPLALLLAVTLECGKISAIIWHYYLHHLSEHDYPAPVRLTSLFLTVGNSNRHAQGVTLGWLYIAPLGHWGFRDML